MNKRQDGEGKDKMKKIMCSFIIFSFLILDLSPFEFAGNPLWAQQNNQQQQGGGQQNAAQQQQQGQQQGNANGQLTPAQVQARNAWIAANGGKLPQNVQQAQSLANAMGVKMVIGANTSTQYASTGFPSRKVKRQVMKMRRKAMREARKLLKEARAKRACVRRNLREAAKYTLGSPDNKVYNNRARACQADACKLAFQASEILLTMVQKTAALCNPNIAPYQLATNLANLKKSYHGLHGALKGCKKFATPMK